jgi:DNA adenine methylase
MLRQIDGKATVSVNDIPEMHEAFASFSISRLSTRYTVMGLKPVERGELIVTNWQ